MPGSAPGPPGRGSSSRLISFIATGRPRPLPLPACSSIQRPGAGTLNPWFWAKARWVWPLRSQDSTHCRRSVASLQRRDGGRGTLPMFSGSCASTLLVHHILPSAATPELPTGYPSGVTRYAASGHPSPARTTSYRPAGRRGHDGSKIRSPQVASPGTRQAVRQQNPS